MNPNQPAAVTAIPTSVRFAFGTASAISATFFTHPIDVIKYFMQLKGGNLGTIGCGMQLVKDNGITSLYKGMSASVMRQASYGTARLGIYTTLLDKFTHQDGSPPPLYQKLAFSASAGGIGAFVGNPFDLCLVRMAADSSLPLTARRNYTSVFDGVSRIARNEGVASLWIGSGPTMTRCVILNMAQLTTYTQAKEELLKTSYFVDNIYCHLASSMISGFVATCASTPFDVAKTRIQYDSVGHYRGMVHCLVDTAKTEGVLKLWSGFTPAYLRLAPQTVLVFVFLEQMNHMYREYMTLK